jgi:hypothetical protein
MNLFISEEELFRAQMIANRCKGVCEMGELLHKFVSAYLLVSKELKEADARSWERICGNDQDDMGTE